MCAAVGTRNNRNCRLETGYCPPSSFDRQKAGGSPPLNETMEKESLSTPNADEDLTPVELAHSIIESLLDHTRVVSDLIALMAQALDQDTTKALTLTPQWQAYLESRRQMERTREEVEKFAALVTKSDSD